MRTGTWHSLVEKPGRQPSPQEVNVCLGSDRVTESVNTTRHLGVLFGSCQEEPGQEPSPGQVGLTVVASGAVRTKPLLPPGFTWSVMSPVVSGAELL